MDQPNYINEEVRTRLGPGHRAKGFYQAFAGTDIQAIMYMPLLTLGDATNSGQKKFKVFAELQTISISSTRSVSPVRVLGRSSPIGYTRGASTIAGTMVFASINADAFSEVYDISIAENISSATTSLVSDQLPPFSIVITAANESGGVALQLINGITLTNYGTTYSIDDLYTETSYCVDPETEALTKRGWKKYNQILATDELLTIDPETKHIGWSPLLSLHTFNYSGDMIHWKTYRGIDILTTPNHRWLTFDYYKLKEVGFDNLNLKFEETKDVCGLNNKAILIAGGNPVCFSEQKIYDDELVELIGWVMTEGSFCYTSAKNPYAVSVAQSESANPDFVNRIRRLVAFFSNKGFSAKEYKSNRAVDQTQLDFYFGKGVASQLLPIIYPNKCPSVDFLCQLTEDQAKLLLQTLLDGDGEKRSKNGLFIQKDGIIADTFQILCAMLGLKTNKNNSSRPDDMTYTSIYATKSLTCQHLKNNTVPYKGIVWCPRTKEATWMARRGGGTFWTGNTYVATDITPMIRDPVSQYRARLLNNLPEGDLSSLAISEIIHRQMRTAYGSLDEHYKTIKTRYENR